jgi:hypothetical protein
VALRIAATGIATIGARKVHSDGLSQTFAAGDRVHYLRELAGHTYHGGTIPLLSAASI